MKKDKPIYVAYYHIDENKNEMISKGKIEINKLLHTVDRKGYRYFNSKDRVEPVKLNIDKNGVVDLSIFSRSAKASLNQLKNRILTYEIPMYEKGKKKYDQDEYWDMYINYCKNVAIPRINKKILTLS